MSSGHFKHRTTIQVGIKEHWDPRPFWRQGCFVPISSRNIWYPYQWSASPIIQLCVCVSLSAPSTDQPDEFNSEIRQPTEVTLSLGKSLKPRPIHQHLANLEISFPWIRCPLWTNDPSVRDKLTGTSLSAQVKT